MSFLVDSNRIETFWRGFNVGRILKHFEASGLEESGFALCLLQTRVFGFFQANILLCKPFSKLLLFIGFSDSVLLTPTKRLMKFRAKLGLVWVAKNLFLIVFSFFFKSRIYFSNRELHERASKV